MSCSTQLCTVKHLKVFDSSMDSQELQKLNALLDREVELREVNFLVLNIINSGLPFLN